MGWFTHATAPLDIRRVEAAAWAAVVGGGCPGGCRERDLADARGTGLRVVLGAGEGRGTTFGLDPGATTPTARRRAVRDRHGNWTYPFCVVVDDMRQDIDLVVRGEDLLDATARQIRLGRLWDATARLRSTTTR